MKKYLLDTIRNKNRGTRAAVLKALLWPLSGLYAILVALRRVLFALRLLPVKKLDKPVISVGNITAGGTGKTPFVSYLVRKIQARNKKAVILIRGYMDRKTSGSDEVKWYKAYMPDTKLLEGADRFFCARHFLNSNSCDCFIMDDGFQHRQLERDLDIVLIDVTDPWGTGHLLPRGFLREGITSLRRADVIVLTKVRLEEEEVVREIQKKIEGINPQVEMIHCHHQPELFYDPLGRQEKALETVSGRKVFAFSSIGFAESFEKTLTLLQAQVSGSIDFMDHHSYSKEDVGRILSEAEKCRAEYITTTEKDLVKLDEYIDLFRDQVKLLVLRIKIQITKGEDELLKRVFDLI